MKMISRFSMTGFRNGLLVCLFLATLAMPWADRLFEWQLDTFQNTEKRTLAKRPQFDFTTIGSFPSLYESYFNDHFAFRNLLVNLNSQFSFQAFGISAIPEVMIGKDGWLYYMDKNQGDSYNDWLGRLEVQRVTLDSIRSKLETRTRLLNSKKIQFLEVVAPDKHSIYPEYLPKKNELKGRYGPRLDQIVSHLSKKSNVQLIDLRKTLLVAKKDSPFPLFLNTDSHWNTYGAFKAYEAIMNSLSMEPRSENDFEWDWYKSVKGGDLAQMLGAEEQFKENTYISCIPKPNLSPTSHRAKLVFFRDSFGEGLLPYLKLHFGEVVDISGNYANWIVEKENPDVVILLTVERYAQDIIANGN